MSTRTVRRAPRVPAPRLPGGELALEPPPEPAKPVPAGPLQRLLPVVMVLGSGSLILVMGVRNPQSWLFGGILALSTVGMLAGGVGRGGTQRAEIDEQRRDYLRYLAQVRGRIRTIAAAQRAALQWTHPSPSALVGIVGGERMWERRETDPDVGQVRVGLGRQRLATRLVAPRTGPLDELEPVCAWALRRLVRAHQVVPDLPVAVALCSLRRVCLRPATPPAPAGPARSHPMPPLAPAGLAPAGLAPAGLAPAGSAREGLAPAGLMPAGLASTGPAPGGLAPAGSPEGMTSGVRMAPVRALARAMLAQYVVWHSPAEARLAVITSVPNAPLWDWVKWLPHAQHPSLTDEIGTLRMVSTDPAEITEWLAAPGLTAPGTASQPRLVVVLDGVDARRSGARWLDRPEITVLRVAEADDVAGERGELTLLADQRRLGMVTEAGGPGEPPTGPNWIGRPDALSVAEATTLARRMARYRPPTGAQADTGRPLRNSASLPELLGMDTPTAISAARARWRSSARDTLRVPLGVGESGEPVLLDLKESGQGGAGPHGLCIGATGSGKSELLRTLLLALAATHSSERLNMVLVDFKGGATFLGMSALPHVSAVITNLRDDMSLVDRMADALAGEINRRQEALRAAGNLAGVADYERKRRTHPDLPPLPALLVVVDEFSEMLTQRPELVELMVQIGRLGRSLHMHLLLASQRLDETRLRGLESHLSYRIALRTFSPAESRAVIGVPDAHLLPPLPGSGYLALGTDELVRFRAAYVSAPADITASAAAPTGASPARPKAFTSARVGARTDDPSAAPTVVLSDSPASAHTEVIAQVVADNSAQVVADSSPEDRAEESPDSSPEDRAGNRAEGSDAQSTVLDVMVAAMTGQGPPAHQVWLAPLDTPPALDSLLPTLAPGPRGLAVEGSTGSLCVPVGLIDRPYYQRWERHVLDLSGAEGHVVVIGAPRSGKSTALRTLLLGLALHNTPPELSVYALDFGGGMLNTLAALPHVASVVDRQHPDAVRRTLAEVSALLADREAAFRDAGVDSVAEFRRRRSEGEFAQDPHGEVFLVVDGYQTLRDEFEDLEAQLLPLAARGLSYGVHLVLTANRWTGLRPALKDLMGTRIELRLGDPGDSEIDRRKAQAVPARPGRGLAPDGGQMVVARPELDMAGGGVAEAVAEVASAWPGPPVPRLRLLPLRLPYPRLLRRLGPDPDVGAAPHRLPVGVDEARLDPVHLDFGADPHLLCFADAESGKTNLLRVLARGVTSRLTARQARIVLVDYRRTLLGQVPASHLIGYASNTDNTASAVREVADALARRMPGPDVTPRQLRERSWWSGPEVYVLVDDYDLVTGASGFGDNPLAPLLEYLPHAKDVGLHLVLARRTGGAARALFEPLIGRLRELATPGLVLSGSPDEGPLLEGVKPTPQPPGRGVLLTRKGGARRVQLALLGPDSGAEEPERAPAAGASSAEAL